MEMRVANSMQSMSLIGLYPETMRSSVSEDQGNYESWSPLRKQGNHILNKSVIGTSIFDMVMGGVILFNALLLIMETDLRAECGSDECVPSWIKATNIILLFIYFFELVLRLYVSRLAFWASPWNWLDAFIVIAGTIGQVAPQSNSEKLSLFRLCRLARVVRVARILQGLTTLTSMLRGFAGAARAMVCGIFLILVMLIMWSILAVEIINPINQGLEVPSYCKAAFTTVVRTTLYFFQTLVAGDSWGYCTIPIIDAAPLTYFLFAGALVSVQLGFTNLVLAVIVDKAAESREGTKAEQRVKKMQEEVESINKWQVTMAALDADKSGTITEIELMEGYDVPVVKKTLDDMNLSKIDVEKLFKTMDIDDSGSLGYDEFADNFHKAQMQDPRIYMMSIKLAVEKIEHKLENVVVKRINDIAEFLRCSEPIPPQHQPLRISTFGRKSKGATEVPDNNCIDKNCIPENFDQVDVEVKQAPRATNIQGGVHGRNSKGNGATKILQTEANICAAPPASLRAAAPGGAAEAAAAPAEWGSAEAAPPAAAAEATLAGGGLADGARLAAELGALQRGLEARLDGIAAEAREAHLHQRPPLELPRPRRPSSPAPPPVPPAPPPPAGAVPAAPGGGGSGGGGGEAIRWLGDPCPTTTLTLKAHNQGLAGTPAAATNAAAPGSPLPVAGQGWSGASGTGAEP